MIAQLVISFFLFVLIQGVAINGLYEATQEKMILHFYRKWLQKQPAWIGKPLGLCVKCMASVWGGILFWGTVLPIFGFSFYEIWIYIVDVFVLVVVNFQIYKHS